MSSLSSWAVPLALLGCWWLAPTAKLWWVGLICLIAAMLDPSIWPAGVVLIWAAHTFRRRMARRAQHQALLDAAPDWVGLLALHAPIAGNLSLAVQRASQDWLKHHPNLEFSVLARGPMDLDLRSHQLAQLDQTGPLISQVAAGLCNANQQGLDIGQWLNHLLEQHYLERTEKLQSKAASVGSKMLMPMVLGALPQAFLIIGFVTLNSEVGL